MRKTLSMILAAALMVPMVGCSGTKNITAEATKPRTEAVSQGSTAEAGATRAMEAKDTSEPLKVGLSFVSLNFPYFVRVYEQFIDGVKRNGWNVSFVDGNLDAATQLNGIQNMINSGVDMMIVNAWFIDVMEDVFAQCKEEGIPVFIIGSTQSPDAINDLIVYVCGTEHYDAGFLGGTWASGYFNDLGGTELSIAIMSGSTEQMKQRGRGFVDGSTKGGIKVEVKNEYNISTKEDAMASAEGALTVYSDLDLVYDVSARGPLGAYDATVGVNWTEIYMIGYDGEGEELESVDKKLNYIVTITQDPAGEAFTTIEYILKYLDGEKFDKIVPISTGICYAEGQLTSEQVLGS